MLTLYIITSLFFSGNLATDFYLRGHLKGYSNSIVFALFTLAFLVFMFIWPLFVIRSLWNALTTSN